MKKSISILGSTGSIGKNVLEIYNKKKNLFNLNILVADKNYKIICYQIKKFKPKIFIINNQSIFLKVKKRFRNQKIKILNKINIKNKHFKKTDITIAAIPGIAGLKPTVEFINKSKKLLIANKESVVCGWNIIKKTSQKKNTKIIPVDSEHFSIFQLLKEHKKQEIKKIYLTASGGPFLNHTLSKLKKVKPNQAIKHPKWKMGKKISIDSATLMNKILEIIEAHKLFSIDINKIDIVIHPESLVHAIIELKNGLFKFIYHETTMIIPLANALLESRLNIDDFIKPLSFKKRNYFFKNLNFLNIDKKKFPIIKLKNRLIEHHSTPIIINAANEILVDQFLRKKISFLSFYRHLLNVLNDRNYKKYAIKEPKDINQVLQIDQWARNTVLKKLKNIKYA